MSKGKHYSGCIARFPECICLKCANDSAEVAPADGACCTRGKTSRWCVDERPCPEYVREDSVENDRTYIVTEVCPHCEEEIEMRWNTDTDGYKAFCPHCGKVLMLCDECVHTEGMPGCDYDHRTDSCQHNRPNEEATT